MKLTVIGCSGSMPGPDSPASCYLIEHEGIRLVLDLGNGSLGALQAAVALDSIDAIVLTHLHADHCLDACSLVVWHRYAAPASPRVRLYGPSETLDRLGAAYEFPAESLSDVYDFTPLAADSAVEIGAVHLRFARMNHPVTTYAVRVEAGGASVVYSGDTGECPALVELARDADVLLCEASAPDDEPDYPPDLHLTGAQAGEHAAAAGVSRLLLTHVPPWVNAGTQLAAARTAFLGAELVGAGQVVEW